MIYLHWTIGILLLAALASFGIFVWKGQRYEAYDAYIWLVVAIALFSADLILAAIVVAINVWR